MLTGVSDIPTDDFEKIIQNTKYDHFVKTEFLYISIIVLYLNTSFADIIAITTEKFEDTKGVIRR